MPSDWLTLQFDNTLDALSDALTAIEAHGEAENWPMKWLFNTNLAIDELVSNIIKYGYADDARHEIAIALFRVDDMLAVMVRDDSAAFDPFEDAPEPDTDLSIEDRPIGGLGVHLVKTLVDDVRYRRVDDRNEITLIQRAAA
ncbi:MAG: ATP-binding protein [Pseudomonadota bacterium]